MLNKRRRASSVASRQEEEVVDDSTPEQSPILSVGTMGSGSGRKRKKLDPSELCQQLYDSIRNIKKEDGSMLCDTFIRAPKRRQEPSYYDVVNHPIDLLRVQQKLKTDSYDDIEELTSDLELLVNNAKAFYKPGSTEYNDACLLWESYNTNKMKLLESIGMEDEPRSKRVGRQQRRSTANEDTQNSSHNSGNNDDDFDPYEELFAAVMTATDPIDNRPLHTEFQLLPSKKLWPDYYDVIEHPIDLRLIATEIQKNGYSNLSEMEKDLLLMTKNALTFNEPGSQIYKDAKTLKKIFTTKKAEIELGKAKPTVSKKRGQSWSAITAALKDEPESSDDDNEGNQNKHGEGPMWQLFDTLYNAASATDAPNATGAPLGQSLWKLPIRRFHPEYYETIKKPISMVQIQKKLKRGDYANMNDLTADLYLMLDNAKRAYPPSHKTHKDAVKMLKLMNTKLADAAAEQEQSDFDEQDQSNASSTSSNRQKKRPRSSSTITPPAATNIATNSMNNITNITTTTTTITPKGAGKPPLQGQALKRKLLNLQKYLTDYTISNRKPMGLFMEKPSKKLYPDYYNIIQHPIDMNTIENNIRSDKYSTIEDCISDYRLMFNNCRKFNEEGSMIYEDANLLEKALNEKLKELSVYNDNKKPITKFTKTARKTLTPREAKLWQLYETIRDYHEPKGNRQLSLIFTKLPNKNNILKNIHKCSWTIEQFDQAMGFFKEGKSVREVSKQCGIPESTLREKRRELVKLNDYPDYYDIIKNPIDMEKILQKLKQQVYENVDEMAADFLLMFENACKYNEPDSQIYKDALVLQQLCIQTKQSLKDSDETVPDVGLAVQELLLSLFTALYNHQDEEGRCYSDSLAELPEYDGIDAENKVRGISLDLVKRRLDKGLYKRLDIFQEDIFSCLERARKLSRTDSQVFEDSIELQAFFIKKRDELCNDVLTSTALNYTSLHLSAAVEAVRQSKLLKEEEDSEDVGEAATGESMTIDQKVYSPGDFVYFDSAENKSTYYDSCPESNRSTLKQNKIPISVPGIAYIERLYTDTNNVKMCYGNIFLRPPETYHVTTRKFLEQEVFKSDQHQAIPLNKLLNKCYVMSIKDYIKFKPEGFQDKDVYVCESRYTLKARSFKKIKNWPFVRDNDAIKFIQRETPLELKRIMSVFKERVEKHKGELAELQLQEALVEKEKPNVACFVGNAEEGNTYFEQYNTICSGVVKTGDYVYVATQSGKQSIAQIQNIWETINGKSYFQGPWLLTPTELPVQINRHFYKQELLLSTVQDISPIIAIVGRCAVLDYNEYTTCRPTEIQESDVYICETTYDEIKKNIRKFVQGQALKKYSYSKLVTQDEIFHFKKPIKPRKVHISALNASQQQEQIKSPLSVDVKSEPSDGIGMLDDSLDDGGPLSVSSDIVATSSPAPSVASTPLTSKTKSCKPQKKVITGYILYSGEIRRGIRNSNPDASFGAVSRMVGIEWKNLPSTIRQAWEDKAAKINEESNAKYLANEENGNSPSPVTITAGESTGPQQIYECLWDNCDYQFEDPIDCMQHCIADGTGHIPTYYADKGTTEGEFQCLWKSCMRFKKNMPPFPNLTRLIKHVREVHLSKGGKVVHIIDKSKTTYVKSKNPIPQTLHTPTSSSTQQTLGAAQQVSPQASGSNQINVQPAAPPEPLFVTVPPRPQRVLHSEAYIKYIEGLQNNANHITPWEKTLRANQQNVPPVDPAKLPTHWLGPAARDRPEEVVNALWHLRNFMMKDVLEIRRNYF